MAKPDLMRLFVTPAGQPFRDDGESSLVPAFRALPNAPDNATASGLGVQISGLYYDSAASNVIKIRTS